MAKKGNKLQVIMEMHGAQGTSVCQGTSRYITYPKTEKKHY